MLSALAAPARTALLTLAAIAALGAWSVPQEALAQDGALTLTLEAVEPVAPYGRFVAVGAGAISEVADGNAWTAQYSWSAPPQTMGHEGFSLTLTTTATTAPGASYSGGASENSSGFTSDPETAWARLDVPATANAGGGSKSLSVIVKPDGNPADGSIVELNIGAAYGPRVVYKYRVSYGGGDGADGDDQDDEDWDDDGEPERSLSVTTDCPSVIEISAYPPILCHLYITGFRRNTAYPIVVSLPGEADGFGNHPNGIQVIGRMQKDVYELGDSFVTDLVIFACPSKPNEARNCYGFAATPGVPVAVTVAVQQGESYVTINLPFTPNSSVRDRGTTGTGNPTLIGTQRAYVFAAWTPGLYLNAEGDVFKLSAIQSDWSSAEWIGEKLNDGGVETIRLCLARTPELCLAIIDGTLQLAPVGREDTSSHFMTPYAEACCTIVHLKSRAFPNLFIHAQNGALEAGPIQPDWLGARWSMQFLQ